MVLLLLGSLGIAAAAEAGCDAPVEPAAWSREMDQAEAAFADLDQEKFAERLALATHDLACLSAPVSPQQAARYHRLVGLEQFIQRDEERARLAFAAAREVDPMGALPARLLPPGHVARALSESASTPGELTPLWLPAGHRLWVDGTLAEQRPTDRDTIVQLEVDGAIRSSEHLRPEDGLPRGVRRRAARTATLWAAGVTSLAVAGVTVGVVVASP